MVNFDSRMPGTAAAVWHADSRLHDRPALSLDGVDELVVVAAHPDDETLGAAGLMKTCADAGLPVRVIMVTDGAPSDDGDLAELRAGELETAVKQLAPDARIERLSMPDGGTREHQDYIGARLLDLIAECSTRALVAAPWRGDGHRDHRVVGELAAANLGGRRLVEYPVWLWHWGEPDHPDVPWDSFVATSVGPEKREAIAAYASQITGDEPVLLPEFLENFDRDVELLIESAPEPEVEDDSNDAIDEAYFDALYDRHDDPWGFDTRWYERRKRALTLAMLPHDRYERALEIGCSIGVLTADLAERCDDLLAVDVSREAVDRARERLGDRATVEQMDVSQNMPEGQFDLIVLSEVGYYWDATTLMRVAREARERLREGGVLLACHWRHPVTDYPLTGDWVHELIESCGIPRQALHTERDFIMAIYSDDDRSVADREGLL